MNTMKVVEVRKATGLVVRDLGVLGDQEASALRGDADVLVMCGAPREVAVGWTWDIEEGEWRPPEGAPAEPHCSARQALTAMLVMGVRPAFEAWATSPERSQMELDYINREPVWYKSSPMVTAGAAALGLSDEQVTDLFELAVTL